MSNTTSIGLRAATNVFRGTLGSESKEGILHSFTVTQPSTGTTNSIAKAGAITYHIGSSDDGIPGHSVSTIKKRTTRKSTKSKFAKKGIDDEDSEEVDIDEASREEEPRLYSGKGARSTVQIARETLVRGEWATTS